MALKSHKLCHVSHHHARRLCSVKDRSTIHSGFKNIVHILLPFFSLEMVISIIDQMWIFYFIFSFCFIILNKCKHYTFGNIKATNSRLKTCKIKRASNSVTFFKTDLVQSLKFYASIDHKSWIMFLLIHLIWPIENLTTLMSP